MKGHILASASHMGTYSMNPAVEGWGSWDHRYGSSCTPKATNRMKQ